MLRLYVVLAVMAWVLSGSLHVAKAQQNIGHGTHVALSVERFMGFDYTDYEGPGNRHYHARILINADEPAPTNIGRFGLDVFIRRFSFGIAGGFTSDDRGVVSPRIGYMIGFTHNLGLWLRGGGFYATGGDVHYFGMSGDVLLQWFPTRNVSFHVGPTFDFGVANNPYPNYVSVGFAEFGLSAWF